MARRCWLWRTAPPGASWMNWASGCRGPRPSSWPRRTSWPTGRCSAAHAQPHTVHDFGGFPAPLYQIQYPAPGDPDLAEQITRRLADAEPPPPGARDHGLRPWRLGAAATHVSRPADIPGGPTVGDAPMAPPRSTTQSARPWRHCATKALLVLGSGGFVHNLGDLDWEHKEAPLAPWAQEFGDWMHARLSARDWPALLDWQQRAPHARHAHPTVEHLMPLFVALGAAGEDAGRAHDPSLARVRDRWHWTRSHSIDATWSLPPFFEVTSELSPPACRQAAAALRTRRPARAPSLPSARARCGS